MQARSHNRRKRRAFIFRQRGSRSNDRFLRARQISLAGPLIRAPARAFTQVFAEELLMQPDRKCPREQRRAGQQSDKLGQRRKWMRSTQNRIRGESWRQPVQLRPRAVQNIKHPTVSATHGKERPWRAPTPIFGPGTARFRGLIFYWVSG